MTATHCMHLIKITSESDKWMNNSLNVKGRNEKLTTMQDETKWSINGPHSIYIRIVPFC